MRKKGYVSGKEIGAIIKKRRRELGMSQEKLAEALNVTYQQVQRYERGSNKLNTDNLQVIAGILQLKVTQFFEGAPEPSPSIPVSEDELKLLRIYRQVKDRGDKALLQRVANRLLSK